MAAISMAARVQLGHVRAIIASLASMHFFCLVTELSRQRAVSRKS